MSRAVLTGGLVIVLAVVAGCSLFGGGDDRDRFVEADDPKAAPSGEFTASLDDGLPTQVVVITGARGTEVFRDDHAYSTRHGVGVTWLSSSDQLWILYADVGTAHVDRQADGRWVKTAITPRTADTVPDEIDRLR